MGAEAIDQEVADRSPQAVRRRPYAVCAIAFALPWAWMLVGYCLDTPPHRAIGTIPESAARAAAGSAAFVMLPLVLIGLVGVVIAPLAFGLAAACWKRVTIRLAGLVTGLFFLAAICAIATYVLVWRGHHSRTFAPVAARGQPIIDAIDRYQEVNGEYPQALADLVPDFIAEIPKTGLAGYPSFEYKRGSRERPELPYAVWVYTPGSAFNFDQFVYWPNGNYEDHYWGGRIEPVGDWVYFHE